MFKYLTLLFFPFAVLSQENSGIHEYIPLQDNKVFDVEIIVFAYKTPLPNINTYTNKAIIDDSTAVTLTLKPENLPFVESIIANNENTDSDISTSSSAVVDQNKSDFTVSIAEEEDNKRALTWFNHLENDYQLSAIWDRLSKQPNIVPLIHQAWRQSETPFKSPTYVKLNNIPQSEFTSENDSYTDLTLTGMVALSKGRYMHFENQLNLIRIIQNEEMGTVENMVFSLDERRQLKTDELNYFDSPWMGSIVKITEYKGSEENQD